MPTYTIDPCGTNQRRVSRDEYLRYLRECATRWRREPRGESEARKVEARARRIIASSPTEQEHPHDHHHRDQAVPARRALGRSQGEGP